MSAILCRAANKTPFFSERSNKQNILYPKLYHFIFPTKFYTTHTRKEILIFPIRDLLNFNNQSSTTLQVRFLAAYIRQSRNESDAK